MSTESGEGGGSRTPDCAIDFEGEPVAAVAGEPIAVSLFAAGTRTLSRSIKFHRPRSFFCLAGHCGACLMRIDGKPNMKACRTVAAEGIKVERQNAFPSASIDMLAAADLFFPRGMDHHTMFTSPRAVNELMQKVVRQLGGLGKLPDAETAPAELRRGRRQKVAVAVVGGGPAGLAAATACARAGHATALFDEADRFGGSLLSHPEHGLEAADAMVEAARAAGVSLHASAPAIAWYPEDDGGLLAVDDRGTLLKVTADRYVYATGAYDVNALFRDNDRPGIFAARAVGALLVRHRVKPSKRPAVLGDGPYARALVAALAEAGCDVRHVDGERERVVAARGGSWVSGLELDDGRKIKCDLVAVAALPAPASELPRQHGAAVELRPEGGGFACVTDEAGRTASPTVFACGDVCGFRGAAAARAHGLLVGVAVAASLAEKALPRERS